MQDKKTEINKGIDTSNIFDDFSQDSSLIEEVDKLKKENNKDKFYYLSKTAHVLQTIFWILFFILIILFSYIYIQNNKNISDSNLLDPLCFVFIGDIKNDDTFCSSISSLNTKYKTRLENAQQMQIKGILGILEKLYEVENFTKTKEIIFLSDKSNNKLKVLEILEKFDNIKNQFNAVDKQKIQCNGISIDANTSTISMSCSAYSAGYERGFKGFDASDDNFIKGTSISIASSFLNFITKKADVFTIIDRQKVFKSESILGEKTDFTNKTSFNLKLKYNLK
ncbi:MAG: hypothetical protein Q8K30_02400 [Candidatus Gracilibacteria bacterium]|nr:hypothetical protein [Candidatus Gracilibacteria bacterium]